jgi:TrmH family RNA methyltransferase
MPRAENITSAANPLLKDIKRAIARGSLTAQGWWVAESFHLLEEALRSGREVHAVLAAGPSSRAVEQQLRRHRGVRLAILPDALLQSISSTETTQGVMSLVAPPAYEPNHLFGRLPLVVVLDGLQDAGNAGTIVRTAEAFGASGVIFVKGTASPHHPKTLRASAGSLFRLPFLHGMNAVEVRDLLRAQGVEVFAAMPSSELEAGSAALTFPCALVIGSEAHGVSEHLRAGARALSIPTAGVESLNAAVAAGILLYEAARQRAARV